MTKLNSFSLLFYLVGDVSAGSDTPSMVSKVLSWRGDRQPCGGCGWMRLDWNVNTCSFILIFYIITLSSIIHLHLSTLCAVCLFCFALNIFMPLFTKMFPSFTPVDPQEWQDMVNAVNAFITALKATQSLQHGPDYKKTVQVLSSLPSSQVCKLHYDALTWNSLVLFGNPINFFEFP